MLLRTTVAGGVLAAITMLTACGGSPADIEELKKGQKEMLAKLESLEKNVQQIKTAPAAAAPARPQVDPNKVYDIPASPSPVKGPKDAKVTIVKFSDYQCPFCAQSAPLIDQVLQAYPNDVNYVYKQFPLTSIHPQAMPASKAALAAGKQGKFWEMHALIFENYRQLSPEKLKELAQQLNLDMAKWEADVNSPAVQDEIEEEMKQARAADVTGTPTIFVNGKRLMNRSFDGFKQAIDSAMAGKG
ncbi:MAG: thioredoxin domain-containing protein [bacterium]|nr:thioredoxin domain-containing protein [bacterium]